MRSESQSKINSRINRITGQVAGVKRMIEEDRYCIDILDQISAVRAALNALGTELLTNHLQHCIIEHGQTLERGRNPEKGHLDGARSEHPQAAEASQEELLEELNKALSRFLK